MKTYIKNLTVALALFMGWLCTSSNLYAFPKLQVIPTPLWPGFIAQKCTDANCTSLSSNIYVVTPVTLQAQGGSPFAGYTWTLAGGSHFPPGTIVDSFTGLFRGNGSPLIPGGPYPFTMIVSDGSSTAQNITFNFNVNAGIAILNANAQPPYGRPFAQANLINFPLANAMAGVGYGRSLYAEGGIAPYHGWSFVLGSGLLPPGMVIDQARGILRGTPSSSAAGHTYSFRVNVLDKTGAIALNHPTYTIGVQPLVPPSAPGFTASSNVTGVGFTVYWSSVDNAAGYDVQISQNSLFANSAIYTLNTPVTSFNFPGAEANTTYYYRVRARNGAGTSGWTSGRSVKTLALVTPSAPTANAPTIGWGPWFRGTWSSVSGARGYLLDVYTSIGYVSGYQNRNVGNVTSWDMTGLSPSTNYSYRVRAYNGAGISVYSNVKSATTSSITPAQMLSPKPGSFNSNGAAFTSSDSNGATFPSSSVTFSWKAGVGVTEYFLFVGNSLGANDLYSGNQGLNLFSPSVPNIPTDGRTIYVHLFSYINGAWYNFNYPYKAFKVSPAPNLTPYQPSGWSNKIVTTHTYGSKTDTSSLVATSPIYVDWAVVNNGASNVTTAFRTNLYVDGVQRISLISSSLSVNSWSGASWIGWSIGRLSHGSHTIKITTDSMNQVSESNESDNTYSKTISVN